MSDDDVIESILAGTVGRQVVHAARGLGTFLTVDFGDREPGAVPVPSVFVQGPSWRIVDEGGPVAHAEDDGSPARLTGLDLIGVTVEARGLNLRFDFAGSVLLETFALGQDDVVTIFLDETSITYGYDGRVEAPR